LLTVFCSIFNNQLINTWCVFAGWCI
jgi:hypothetical protein